LKSKRKKLLELYAELNFLSIILIQGADPTKYMKTKICNKHRRFSRVFTSQYEVTFHIPFFLWEQKAWLQKTSIFVTFLTRSCKFWMEKCSWYQNRK